MNGLPDRSDAGSARPDGAVMRRAALPVLLALALLCCGAAGTVGGLYVTTDPPGSAVYVDGRLQGVSPCGIADVPVGAVEVRVEQQGYAPVTRNVEVKAGETTELALTLRPAGPVGSIAVLMEPPGARIELDRVPAGRSPAVLLNVRPGTRRLVVTAEGHRALHSTVNVTPDSLHTVRATLEPVEGRQTGDADAAEAALERVDPRRAPLPEELPEDAALETVRRLVAERRYEEALRALDEMAGEEPTPGLVRRIGRTRTVVNRLSALVERAHEELRAARGEQYVLSLRPGIRLSGKIVEVADGQVAVELREETRSLPLRLLAARQIIRLASRQLDTTDPANLTAFALLHAAEGEFDDAYGHLQEAAAAGHDVRTASSYLRDEETWAAARQRQQALARAGGPAPAPRLLSEDRRLQLLIDRHRGTEPELPEAVLEPSLFDVRRVRTPVAEQATETTDLLLVRDPGTARAVAPFERQEVQRIMDFVHGGGGLVFIGAPRPPDQPHPFAPLLRWCGALVEGDRLALIDAAPARYPRRYALCAPPARTRHPVTARVGRVVFPLASPSLRVTGPAWPLLRASPYVERGDGERAPVMAVAGTYGRGRFVVLAAMPLLNRSASEESPFYRNDGGRFLQAALLWASRRDEDTR